ncbi:MAG: DNA polymerase III subunit chi [Gammaproteobacteria bacterium]|nr:DNA polymerase III subunit chi [Gammaproteobacteria bacterium]
MTKIDFYILKGQHAHDRQVFACRLAEKAYKLGHQIYIHARDAEQCEQLNQALWSFRSDSFVPHQLDDGQANEQCPILIGHSASPPRLMDLLINLNTEQPLFFSQFERVAEIIDDNEHIKVAGRQRFQFYKQRGYHIDTHHI